MKILKINIAAFGALSDVRFSFTDGLNTICRENGYGKSTLIGFIKAMLYGFSDTKKQSLSENDRKKYLPWSGGVCGGSLTIETRAGCWRIERTFGERASEDTLAVYEAQSGLRSDKLGTAIGHTLFGIDAEGFLRTLCLSERSFPDGLKNESIADRLSRTVESGGDLKGTDDAIALLQKQQKQLQKRGGRGEIALLGEQISRHRSRLITLEGAAGRAKEIRAQREEKKELLNKHQEELSALYCSKSPLAMREQALRTRAAQEEQYRALTERLSALDSALGDDALCIEEIDRMQRLEDRLDYMSRESIHSADELRSLFDRKLSRDELDMRINVYKSIENTSKSESTGEFWKAHPELIGTTVPSLAELKTYQKRQRILAFFPFFFFLFGVGAFLLIAAQYLAPVLYYLGAAFLFIPILFFLFSPLPKQKKSVRRRIRRLLSVLRGYSSKELCALFSERERVVAVEHAQKENQKKEAELCEFLSRFGIRADTLSQGVDELCALYHEYEKLSSQQYHSQMEQTECDRLMLARFYERYRSFGTPPYAALRKALYERDTLRRERQMLQELLSAPLTNDSGEGDDPKERVALLEKEIRELEISLARMDEELSHLDEDLEGLDEERAVLQELCTRRDNYERRLEILSKTEDYLRLAKRSMESTYLAATKESFSRILGALCEDAEGVMLNQSLEILREEHGLTRPFEAFSRGERDLYQLAMRLSLIDTLYDREDPPPILLDDPFIAFDDTRLQSALSLLESLARRTQIIYLTCSKGRTSDEMRYT